MEHIIKQIDFITHFASDARKVELLTNSQIFEVYNKFDDIQNNFQKLKIEENRYKIGVFFCRKNINR